VSFCQFCGKAVNADARFCNACGKPANLPYAASPSSASPAGAVALPMESEPVAAAVAAAATAGAQGSVSTGRAHRPPGVTILAVLAFLALIPSIILGAVLAVYAASASAEGSIPLAQHLMQLFPVLAKGQHDMLTGASAAAVAMFAIAAFFAVISYGLWRLRKWGRVVAIAWSGLCALRGAALIFIDPSSLIWQLFVIAINVWIVMYLLKPHVKQAFGARPA
jgi:uncharacterized membrane protein (DUF2068 family)